MDIFHYPGPPLSAERYASTVGFFDGVHLGHRYLLQQLSHEASLRDLKSMVVTFDRHPREVVRCFHAVKRDLLLGQPQLLSTLNEKVELLSQTGIDTLVVLHFDEAMAALSAREFMSDVLYDQLHSDLLLTGYDNRFGHGRTESFADYERYGRGLGMEVVCAQPLMLSADTGGLPGEAEKAVCSSIVRRLIADGDVTRAAKCLGRCYSVSGQVVHGERKGHDLGFPTANLQPCDPQKLIPARGAYAVMATLADGTRHHAMTNIGTRPTFHGQGLTLETNIFDESGELYGQQLTIEFVARLRDEQTFDSLEALAAQLTLDRQKAKQLLHIFSQNAL